MIKYKPYKNTPYNDEFIVYGVLVEKPLDHLSLMFEGNETSIQIQELITDFEAVKKGEKNDVGFGNQAGFGCYAYPKGKFSEEPNGGVDIYDDFGPEDPIFTVPLEEFIQLLKDFKAFLVENGR